MSIDPGVRNCGWAIYKNGGILLGTIVTKKKSTDRFIGSCRIVYSIITQLLDLYKEHNIKYVLVEQQGARIHPAVHIFVGMLTYMLLSKHIGFEFIHPKSLGTVENNFTSPSKEERAIMLAQEFGVDGEGSVHATDAGYLILHYLRRKY